jgi:Cdc6-like AAA superfamily ATPase
MIILRVLRRKEIVKIPLVDIFIPLKFVAEAKITCDVKFLKAVKKDYGAKYSKGIREYYGEPSPEETSHAKSSAKIIDMDNLLEYDNCVILGNPGSGKTTLLKRLIYGKKLYSYICEDYGLFGKEVTVR